MASVDGPEAGGGTADPDLAHEPAAAARQRRSRGRFYGGVLVIGLLVVLALALSRWLGLGPTLLDPDRVERDVATQFEERYDVGVDIDCPHGMEVVEGRDYECDAETDDHEDLELVITITDEDDAAYTWDVD
ncbi:DUF4333 domain-containing protein [Blastococcus sp. TML/M2B]|uniref:DUF4333 domain-containing protein n=1 Tax=unclassified Blastococcus TaxID=2619396 RepID=UPI00190E4549|nr:MULTISPECIES: DUF4333 domain-containing protein [unclassified Blastococcus]MBN1092681.1 DUF4333 domain-containing protein [Blastococcus sp. TML/M2B]MBN1097210.1 DUF4333 domain-containing protein [Blastococcus sp. TML/C7B]